MNEENELLKEELRKKTLHETLLIEALCNVIKYILISITVISCVVVASYFWSPQSYDEYNQDSKNVTVEGSEING